MVLQYLRKIGIPSDGFYQGHRNGEHGHRLLLNFCVAGVVPSTKHTLQLLTYWDIRASQKSFSESVMGQNAEFCTWNFKSFPRIIPLFSQTPRHAALCMTAEKCNDFTVISVSDIYLRITPNASWFGWGSLMLRRPAVGAAAAAEPNVYTLAVFNWQILDVSRGCTVISLCVWCVNQKHSRPRDSRNVYSYKLIFKK